MHLVCLLRGVVVSPGLTRGLIFRVKVRFRCCMIVMASSRGLVPVPDSCSCICMVCQVIFTS